MCFCSCVCVCRQAGAICSPQGLPSYQSVNAGGAWLISHPSSPLSLIPKNDALGNKANQYASLQPSLSMQSQDIISHLSLVMSLLLIRHHYLVYEIKLAPYMQTEVPTNWKSKQAINKATARVLYKLQINQLTKSSHVLWA